MSQGDQLDQLTEEEDEDVEEEPAPAKYGKLTSSNEKSFFIVNYRGFLIEWLLNADMSLVFDAIGIIFWSKNANSMEFYIILGFQWSSQFCSCN